MEKLRPQRLGHLVLAVRDIHASVKFYTEIMGLQVSDWISDQMVFLRAGTDHHEIRFALRAGLALATTGDMLDSLLGAGPAGALALGRGSCLAFRHQCLLWRREAALHIVMMEPQARPARGSATRRCRAPSS